MIHVQYNIRDLEHARQKVRLIVAETNEKINYVSSRISKTDLKTGTDALIIQDNYVHMYSKYRDNLLNITPIMP